MEEQKQLPFYLLDVSNKKLDRSIDLCNQRQISPWFQIMSKQLDCIPIDVIDIIHEYFRTSFTVPDCYTYKLYLSVTICAIICIIFFVFVLLIGIWNVAWGDHVPVSICAMFTIISCCCLMCMFPSIAGVHRYKRMTFQSNGGLLLDGPIFKQQYLFHFKDLHDLGYSTEKLCFNSSPHDIQRHELVFDCQYYEHILRWCETQKERLPSIYL